MRLWTLHPRYLDPAGLVAVWREALLARHVLLGRTRGYRHHPQLQRFRSHPRPIAAINTYLACIHGEAQARGYSFDLSKIGRVRTARRITEHIGQMEYERAHLAQKLTRRNKAWFASLQLEHALDPHPLFSLVEGPVQPWEVVREAVRPDPSLSLSL